MLLTSEQFDHFYWNLKSQFLEWLLFKLSFNFIPPKLYHVPEVWVSHTQFSMTRGNFCTYILPATLGHIQALLTYIRAPVDLNLIYMPQMFAQRWDKMQELLLTLWKLPAIGIGLKKDLIICLANQRHC